MFFARPALFREWLERTHETHTELLVGFFKRDSGHESMTWPESVAEALCFGWIDGVRRRLDDSSYTIRFTPRKSIEHWSTVNPSLVLSSDPLRKKRKTQAADVRRPSH